ncbi:MAG: gluconokinase [Phycisphaeraceae bacterium]
MTTALYLGLDIGTTACKTVAIDDLGKVHAKGTGKYPTYTPEPGTSEQDVIEVWQGVRDALKELTSQVAPAQLKALGLSGAMHSFLPITSEGQPLARALTWADTRQARDLLPLRKRLAALKAYERTGCPSQWLYHPARLAWWREAHGLNLNGGFVAIKDWILLQLTGKLATDTCIASSTGWLDMHKRTWDEKLLSLSGLHRGQLPTLLAPTDRVGTILPGVSRATGLPLKLPVYPGGSDGGMANLGSGAVAPNTSGSVVITVGTSGAVRVTTDKPLLDPQQRTWCYNLTGGLWFAGGAINNGGLAVDRIRSEFYGDLPEKEGFTQLFADAKRTEAGAEGVLLLPFYAGERTPHWRPDLQPDLLNFSDRERRHVARAALEAVAFCLADVWEVLQPQVSIDSRRFIRLTGGITQSHLWSQIVCDVLGVPLVLSEAADASAIGAALTARAGLQGKSKVEWVGGDEGTRIEPDSVEHVNYKSIRRGFAKAVAARVKALPRQA